MPSTTESIAAGLRRTILQTAFRAREGHIASALSIVDIVWVLYGRILKCNARQPGWEGRDRFFLSKGHGCLALYAVLVEKGYFGQDVLNSFASFHSPLGGHPDRTKCPGVEASTGSLGHGLPMAVGAALALRIKQSSSRVYCLVGDGECNEGSIWEACLLASHHRLSSLCCIVDFNHSTDRALDLGNLEAKFQSMGFETETVDGHDHEQLTQALASGAWSMPRAVIARTVKGKGCPEMENDPAWHHRIPSPEEFEGLMREIG